MSTDIVDYRSRRAGLVYAAFVFVVFAVGGLIGTQSLPDAWYQSLAKPVFNPPNWVFGPVWGILYVMIGVAGARTFLREPRGLAMGLWGLQMLLNWAWSPTWFTLHLLWPAFAVIAAIFVLILAFIATNWKADRTSAVLFVPYALWVAFAGSLNLSIALLN